MSVSMETFAQVALEDDDAHWELVCGALRRKPDMTADHNQLMNVVGVLLGAQVHGPGYVIRIDSGYLRAPGGSFYRADVAVIPRTHFESARDRSPQGIEIYDEAISLVVEVWSPSTGDYDVETKLPEYQRRGDAEIWRLHPYERTLTTWRRQADGSYSETVYREGVVEPIALPGVRINLADLFE